MHKLLCFQFLFSQDGSGKILDCDIETLQAKPAQHKITE